LTEEKKRKINPANAWRESKELLWARRYRLAAGLALMLVSRLSGLVLPASSKFLIDQVIGKHRYQLLLPLAFAAGAATLIQAVTSFALSQILGVAAQHSITDMRRAVQRHVSRLPVRYFDSTKSGVLISRIMNDAEGIRNLVGTGLVQLVGSVVTATIALFVLFYLNWHLTLITLVTLSIFGAVMSLTFKRVRPLFRERGEINAQVTGRLAESLGGIRVVKAYTAEKREERIFEHHHLGVWRHGHHDGDLWCGRRHHDDRRRSRHPRRTHDAWRLRHVHLLHRPRRDADHADRLDRDADQ